MMNVALIGGAGFIGRYIAAALVAQGDRPVLLSRAALGPQATGVETRSYDVDVLQAALAGMDAVIFLPGILHGTEADFEQVHVQLAMRVMQACRAAGIRRYVHMSALGAAIDGPSQYLRSKGRAEAAVMSSDLDWTILRPSVVFGRGDRFITLFAHMSRFLPVLPLAGAHARFQPVWVEDVAAAFALCLRLPETAGQRYDLVGPEVHSLADIARLSARAAGHRLLVLPLPDGVARCQARVMELLPGALMSRDNLDSMKVDNISARDFPSIFGRQPAALEAIIPLYLGQ